MVASYSETGRQVLFLFLQLHKEGKKGGGTTFQKKFEFFLFFSFLSFYVQFFKKII